MPTITFVQTDGSRETVEAAYGTSVMRGAIRNGIEGIVAECGGSCLCGTCHVFVQEDQAAKLPKMSDDEDAMLDGTAVERGPNSRLSCQVTMTEAVPDLVVHMPERQT